MKQILSIKISLHNNYKLIVNTVKYTVNEWNKWIRCLNLGRDCWYGLQPVCSTKEAYKMTELNRTCEYKAWTEWELAKKMPLSVLFFVVAVSLKSEQGHCSYYKNESLMRKGYQLVKFRIFHLNTIQKSNQQKHCTAQKCMFPPLNTYQSHNKHASHHFVSTSNNHAKFKLFNWTRTDTHVTLKLNQCHLFWYGWATFNLILHQEVVLAWIGRMCRWLTFGSHAFDAHIVLLFSLLLWIIFMVF